MPFAFCISQHIVDVYPGQAIDVQKLLCVCLSFVLTDLTDVAHAPWQMSNVLPSGLMSLCCCRWWSGPRSYWGSAVTLC